MPGRWPIPRPSCSRAAPRSRACRSPSLAPTCTAPTCASAPGGGRRSHDLALGRAREALIVAAVDEKETGVEAERPRVAAVCLNRVKRGMRLQSDPRAIYALTEGTRPLGRELTRADLDRQS